MLAFTSLSAGTGGLGSFPAPQILYTMGVLGRCAQTRGTAVGMADTEHEKLPTNLSCTCTHLTCSPAIALPHPWEGDSKGIILLLLLLLLLLLSDQPGQGQHLLAAVKKELTSLWRSLRTGSARLGGTGALCFSDSFLGGLVFSKGLFCHWDFNMLWKCRLVGTSARDTEHGIHMNHVTKSCGPITLSQYFPPNFRDWKAPADPGRQTGWSWQSRDWSW